MEIREALTFDDVLLVPGASEVLPADADAWNRWAVEIHRDAELAERDPDLQEQIVLQGVRWLARKDITRPRPMMPLEDLAPPWRSLIWKRAAPFSWITS